MKTKQEQIEEMKTLLLETYIEWLDMPATDKKPNLYDMDANKLYNAGYRKIPENAVVLTKEEYIDLSRNYVTEQIEQVRNKTAKEILLLLGKGYDETEKTEFNNLQWYKEFCCELKHRYGVEVEE